MMTAPVSYIPNPATPIGGTPPTQSMSQGNAGAQGGIVPPSMLQLPPPASGMTPPSQYPMQPAMPTAATGATSQPGQVQQGSGVAGQSNPQFLAMLQQILQHLRGGQQVQPQQSAPQPIGGQPVQRSGMPITAPPASLSSLYGGQGAPGSTGMDTMNPQSDQDLLGSLGLNAQNAYGAV